MRATWMADLFRHGGLEVVEYGDWWNQGSDRFGGLGDIWHDTVTGPRVSDMACCQLLRNGRPDLKGPLSQRGTGRDGTVFLIAAGRSNHNGYGFGGNDWFGNEMFNDGVGEPFPAAQVESAERQTALLAQYLGWSGHYMLGHKESDPKRKIDPTGMYMPAQRAVVAGLAGLDLGDDDDVALTPDEKATLEAIRVEWFSKGGEAPTRYDKTRSNMDNAARIKALDTKVAEFTGSTSTYLAAINTALAVLVEPTDPKLAATLKANTAKLTKG